MDIFHFSMKTFGTSLLYAANICYLCFGVVVFCVCFLFGVGGGVGGGGEGGGVPVSGPKKGSDMDVIISFLNENVQRHSHSGQSTRVPSLTTKRHLLLCGANICYLCFGGWGGVGCWFVCVWGGGGGGGRGVVVVVVCLFDFLFVCLLVGCFGFKQHPSIPPGRLWSNTYTCCHTETETAD